MQVCASRCDRHLSAGSPGRVPERHQPCRDRAPPTSCFHPPAGKRHNNSVKTAVQSVPPRHQQQHPRPLRQRQRFHTLNCDGTKQEVGRKNTVGERRSTGTLENSPVTSSVPAPPVHLSLCPRRPFQIRINVLKHTTVGAPWWSGAAALPPHQP